MAMSASIAGPSEILVLADETANPRYVAADLLSQAEHDELASAILITTSEELAKEVSRQTKEFTEQLARKEIIQKSLDNYGYILVADTMEDAIDAANEIASEHMEILTKNPYETMTKIRHAGAMFLGNYSSDRLAIISQGQIMYCRQTEQPNSSHRFPWMIISRSPVLSLIPERHLRQFTRILNYLPVRKG